MLRVTLFPVNNSNEPRGSFFIDCYAVCCWHPIWGEQMLISSLVKVTASYNLPTIVRWQHRSQDLIHRASRTLQFFYSVLYSCPFWASRPCPSWLAGQGLATLRSSVFCRLSDPPLFWPDETIFPFYYFSKLPFSYPWLGSIFTQLGMNKFKKDALKFMVSKRGHEVLQI